jgi:hypothetical protein
VIRKGSETGDRIPTISEEGRRRPHWALSPLSVVPVGKRESDETVGGRSAGVFRAS